MSGVTRLAAVHQNGLTMVYGPRIDPELLDVLVAIGEVGPTPRLLAQLAGHEEKLAARHRRTWDEATRGMEGERVFALLRGVIIASEKLRWRGGSVASGVWLKGLIKQRFPELRMEVVRWVRSHSAYNLHYLTCDDQPHEYLSPEELATYLQAEQTRLAKHAKVEAAARADAERRREAHRRRVREKDARAARQADLRREKLRELETKSGLDRIRRVIQDETVTLAWYPVNWGDLTSAELRQLDCEELHSLVGRLRRRSSRSWRTNMAALVQEIARRGSGADGYP